jgi:LuxR family maltose regulon positive regulatory protein
LREGYVVLARIQNARGDLDEAFRALDQAEQYADRTGHRTAGRRARAYETRLRVATGDLHRAASWAAVSSVDATIDGPAAARFEHEVEALTLVRVWIAQGRTEDALRLLGRLGPLAEAAGRVTSIVEMLALEALARAAHGDDDRARACLVQALTLAEPSGMVRLFADEGVAMARLLEALAAAQRSGGLADPAPSPWYLRRLLAAFAGEIAAPVATGALSPAVHPPALPEPLTPRELELLRLMATGASNQQLADRLVVALPTVKTHVNRIFRKLDAVTRIEAVTRARDLGLLGQSARTSPTLIASLGER